MKGTKTLKEVADELGVTSRTVYSYIKRGIVNPIRVGGWKYAFTKEDIKALTNRIRR